MIQRRIPLEIFEVPTGTPVFDWTVPKEWNIRDAYIKDSTGKRIVDFQQYNLHVLNYSTPVHAIMPLTDLRPHLFTLPDIPTGSLTELPTIRELGILPLASTSCWRSRTGHMKCASTPSLEDGHLTYGECYLAWQFD